MPEGRFASRRAGELSVDRERSTASRIVAEIRREFSRRRAEFPRVVTRSVRPSCTGNVRASCRVSYPKDSRTRGESCRLFSRRERHILLLILLSPPPLRLPFSYRALQLDKPKCTRSSWFASYWIEVRLRRTQFSCSEAELTACNVRSNLRVYGRDGEGRGSATANGYRPALRPPWCT